jgi:3'-phosphoadenosine 5'-phosphosulfate sulfotransferase (PAPS reductase)/FAD synthetase
MIKFVQVSGGRTSGRMAELLKGDPDTQFMFQNTGREKPQTYDFLNKMDKEWGLNLIWLEYWCPDPKKKATFRVVSYETANRDGLPFAQLIEKRKAIPNKFKRFCTAELKVKTARRFIRAQGLKRWEYAVGYRADEPNRKVRSDTMQKTVTPLRDLGITAMDIAEFWKNNSFDLDLPIMPNGKTFGGNCEGCFWHSEYQNAMLCKERPESVDWLIEQEEKMGYTFNENFSFKELKHLVNILPESSFSDEELFCTATNGTCGI